MTFNQQIIIELIKAIPFLIIGLITVYIAYRQYKLENSKLDKELYEKRLNVYKKIDEIFFKLVAKEKIDEPMLHSASFSIQERYFLFSEKLNKEIDDFVYALWEAREIELNKNFVENKNLIKNILKKETPLKDTIKKETAIRYKRN